MKAPQLRRVIAALRETISGKLLPLTAIAVTSVTVALAPPAIANNGGGGGGGGAPQNFWGGYNLGAIATDITKPVSSRSYFTTSVAEAPYGADLTVEIFHGKLNSPVSHYLQVAINDGTGTTHAIPFMQLDDNVKDNPKLYYSKRTFKLDYAKMNAELQKILPPNAKHLTIGPGTPLFLLAIFPDYNHQWGSIGRGGIFFMPEKPGQGNQVPAGVAVRRATELDLAYTITETMSYKYNEIGTNAGLKPGGQIRSRLESEGKFQIPLEQVDQVRSRLFEIANNPELAKKLLGDGWKIGVETAYMKKDARGKLILDPKTGLPVPDPMVDTYYDNKKYDAARNDMAIRYRWTEGNRAGAWNFKPGLTSVSKDGIADRLEFGVDATDNKPKTIKKFADSMDPLNPFRLIRDVVPGATPSDFFYPAAQVTDIRYKFKLQHTNGLVVEVSLDEVMGTSLRHKKSKVVHYAQMEMDIDHVSTNSSNVVNAPVQWGGARGLRGDLTREDIKYLKGLGKNAVLEGRPVMHTVADLKPNSPVKQKNKADFQLALNAIRALRKDLVGTKFLVGPQKYALVARGLGFVGDQRASGSVQNLMEKKKELEQKTNSRIELMVRPRPLGKCGSVFNY